MHQLCVLTDLGGFNLNAAPFLQQYYSHQAAFSHIDHLHDFSLQPMCRGMLLRSVPSYSR